MRLFCTSPDTIEDTLSPLPSTYKNDYDSTPTVASSQRRWRFGFRSPNDSTTSANSATPAPAVMSPAAIGRTKSRRLSLQNPFGTGFGTAAAETTDSEGTGGKQRRRVSKVLIGQPEGFRHENHLGADTAGTWNVESWRADLEKTFKPSMHAATETRPKGPRESLSRPGSSPGRSSMTSLTSANTANTMETGMMAITPTTSAPTLSRSASERAFTPNDTSMGIMPSSAGSTTLFFAESSTTTTTTTTNALSRSMSAGAASGRPRVRRKPVPQPLPVISAEVSPFPTMLAPKEEKRALPFTAPEEKKVKELVPLLGVPTEDATYVTHTTKARWDGAMAEIVKALRDPSQ